MLDTYDTLTAALEYLDAGLPVMPVDRETKTPLVKWKGLQVALPTADDWEAWLRQFPGAQVGLVTGRLAGVVVVEGDSPEACAWIERVFPYTPRRTQTRRGMHYYFRHPGWHVHNSTSRLYPDVDVKGDGGYVRVPPSVGYEWVLDPGADWEDLPVFAYPSGMAEPGAIDLTSARIPEPRVPVAVTEGSRDNNLARFAGTLARAGCDLQEILDALAEVNRTYMPPVTDADLVRIAQSIYGAEQRKRATVDQVEADEPQPPIRFRLRSATELINLPPVEWLIDKRLTRGGFSCVFGAPASGKTFLALSMGLSVATGERWGSRPVVQGDVVYVAAEGVAGIGQRISAWCEHHQVDAPERFFGITEAVNLLDENEVSMFILSIKAQSEQPELVMIDTLALCIPGGDENSSLDVGLAIRCVKRIQRETGAHVMLIHHSSKADPSRERGSGALRGAVDTMIAVQVDEAGIRTVTCVKQKDDEPFDYGGAHWELRKIGNSCVIEQAEAPPQDLTQGIDLSGVKAPRAAQSDDGSKRKLTANQLRVLEAFLSAPGGLTKAEAVDASDLVKSSCYTAVDRLVDLGYLAFDAEGKRYTAIAQGEAPEPQAAAGDLMDFVMPDAAANGMTPGSFGIQYDPSNPAHSAIRTSNYESVRTTTNEYESPFVVGPEPTANDCQVKSFEGGQDAY